MRTGQRSLMGILAAVASIAEAVTPGGGDQILVWLVSLANPDDLISVGFTVWIAAGGALGAFVESSLPAASPADAPPA